LGRVSLTIFSGDGDDEILTSFGAGAGYQWRIDTAFVLRVEGQYQRLLVSDDDDANEFSLTIGIGTRFGNSNNPQ
jgi:opacity protein-like surface antigen